MSRVFTFSSRPRKELKLSDWIEGLDGTVTCRKVFPASEATYGSFGKLSAKLVAALKKSGIDKLYSHQATAVEHAMNDRDVVVVTPTASGKTLCYNLPVADAVLHDSGRRALYIFPTKALAHDQLVGLSELSDAMGVPIKTFTYDGDTPQQSRTKIREMANVVITNPDMLHAGILPHHEKWAGFFRGLKYIVVDELHVYRGVFGSHLANLFSRLQRICDLYGSSPVFICCSATTANPGQHAQALTGRKFSVISESGAPSPEKEFIIYNPQLVENRPGSRGSADSAEVEIAKEAMARGMSAIVFSRTRTMTDLLSRNLRGELAKKGLDPSMVASYRGGYLPQKRREIERGLRNGELRCVISTNALELGIDIGSLDLVVLSGYPGSVASTWQRMGRAGRRGSASQTVLVASSAPVDQFIAAKPQWLLGASPELARIDRKNPYILVDHVKCAAYERPFPVGETFAGEDVSEILEYLAKHGALRKARGRDGMAWHWCDASYPASEVSMRSISGAPYSIICAPLEGKPKTLGTMDRQSAMRTLFPGAIYLDGDCTYIVKELDRENARCVVDSCGLAGYYTEGQYSDRVAVSQVYEKNGLFGWGEVQMASTPSFYRKRSISTHKIIGVEDISLPEEIMETTACWIVMPDDAYERRSAAVSGLVNLIGNVAPLFLMCDAGDIRVTPRPRAPGVGRGAIFVADNIPGGVGLAEGVFGLKGELLAACLDALNSCACREGCPVCIGTSNNAPDKTDTSKLIKEILAEK